MLDELGLSEREKAVAKAKADAKRAKEITEDFERRREERRSLESGWLLNMNFYSGNQYCDVSPFGGVQKEDERFYWQSEGCLITLRRWWRRALLSWKSLDRS